MNFPIFISYLGNQGKESLYNSFKCTQLIIDGVGI